MCGDILGQKKRVGCIGVISDKHTVEPGVVVRDGEIADEIKVEDLRRRREGFGPMVVEEHPDEFCVLSGGVAIVAGCTNPRAEANTATALNDAANEISALKSDIAQIQTDMDSLRTIVAHQDSLIS